MPASFLHRWTSLLLAATYLVVGATGDGLYYLVESPEVGQAAGSHASESYAHDHGDGHWHYHGGQLFEDATAADDQRGGEDLVDRDASNRHEHTTLLLAIAAAIELSVLAPLPFTEAPPAELRIGARDFGLVSATERASHGPRGPPVDDLA